MFSIISTFLNVYRRPLFFAAVIALLAISTVFVGCQQSATPQAPQKSSVTQVEPSITLASLTVSQNGELSLSAEGFAPGETITLMVSDGSATPPREVGHAKTDADGRVDELTIQLPDWVTSGARALEAQGQNSGRRTESTFYVRAEKPWISLGSYAAKRDSRLSLIAGGFEPGETVNIFLEQSPQTILASAVADLAGNIEWTEVGLRGFRAGEHRLILEGVSSQIRLSESIVISPRAPWVGLHVYTIGPGGSIGFDGHDFAPRERVQVFLDEPVGEALVEAVADEAGNFTVNNAYTAKPDDVGRHRMILVGELTTENTIVSFDVVPFTPAFQMTTYSGSPGTETSFNGYGFAPGETVKVFIEGQEQPVATILVDDNGSFEDAGRFMVPRNVTGANLGIMLVGEASGVRLRQSFSVIRIQPFLGLDTYSGPPGSVVRFRGLGFAAGENVTIHVGNREGPRVATVIADLEGRFENSAPYSIPGDATQDVAFTAIGAESGAEATVKFQVILPVHER